MDALIAVEALGELGGTKKRGNEKSLVMSECITYTSKTQIEMLYASSEFMQQNTQL